MSHGLTGGHPETEGIAPDGSVIGVVEHEHTVDLNLTRYELSLSRTFNETHDAVIRIPYLIKDQTAGVLFPNGGSPEEREAAIRAGYTHHRTATYEGFSDIEATLGWKKKDAFGENTVMRISFGLALPTGATESDPLTAGERGLVHQHIQFGNGTFDPVLDFYAGIPLHDKWAFSLYAKGRFPLYENSKGYHGSIEGMVLPRLTYLANKKWSLSAGLAANYYGYAEWHGRRDPNSGQFTLNASLGTGFKLSERFSGSLSVLLPLYTDSFSEGDALDPAPTWSASFAWTF